MKLIGKKTAFFMSLGLLVMLFIFLGHLTGFDRVFAQGAGQGGQTLGLGGLGGFGGLGLGGLMMPLGVNMTGIGVGMGAVNPLGPGFPIGVSGLGSMLGTGPGMIGGTVYGGSGLYGMYGGLYGMYGGPFGMPGGMYGGMYGGLYGMYGGPFGMPGGMYGGMYAMSGGPFGMPGGMYGMYGGLSPYSTFISPEQAYILTGMLPVLDPTNRQSQGTLAEVMVPFFYGMGGSYYTPPLPPGISLHIDVIGYVYDDVRYQPLEDVKVSSKYSRTAYSVKTGNNGRFVIELFPDRYTLVFSKDGYQDTEIDVTVVSGMKSLTVNMAKKAPNKAPVLDIPYIDVIAGEEITLDSDDLINDPDGDPIPIISYSEWKAEYWQAGSTYTTTEADIGSHDVYIEFSDGKSSLIKDTLVINIYPGYEMVLYEGFNLISYPFENGDPNFSAFDLMEKLGGSPKIDSIMFYDNITDQYITAGYDSNENPIVDKDFPIKIGQGYIIYAKDDITKKVINRYDGAEQDLELYKGMNLVGIASCPEVYTSYELLLELKEKDVDSIYRYDPFWGDWESTYWLNGSPVGDIFSISKGEGYHIQIKESD